jgi:hypothetical protein
MAIGLLAILFGVAAINGKSSVSLLLDAIKRASGRLWTRARPGSLAIAGNGPERR